MKLSGTAVLVIEVVGVLPYIESEERAEALGDGVAGAGLLSDNEGVVRGGGEPNPARAEEGGAFGFEFGLEGFEGAPLFLDLGYELGFLQFARCCVVRRFELGEVEVVVENLTGVVEDGGGGLASAGRLDHDVLKRHRFVLGAGNELVQVVDVGLEVLSVVEADSAGADDGIERIVRIWELDE